MFIQNVQPSGPTAQVCIIKPLLHRMAFNVQAMVQHAALGALPEQAPLVQARQFVPGSGLTAEFLNARLQKNGFLLIVYNINPGGPAHTNVIYGVRVRSNGSFVRLMDPMFFTRTLEVPLSHYTTHDFVGVLWAND